MDQWLVRTADNWIAGPYPAEQVRQMVLEGKLTLQDEVCAANGYWIYLHEREEILQNLGVEVPRAAGQTEDEITETSTVYEDEVTDSDIQDSSQPAATQLSFADSQTENTAVIDTSAIRELRPKKKKETAKKSVSKKEPAKKEPAKKEAARKEVRKIQSAATYSIPHPSSVIRQVEVVGGQVEKSSFWRGFAWFLVGASALLAIAAISLSRH